MKTRSVILVILALGLCFAHGSGPSLAAPPPAGACATATGGELLLSNLDNWKHTPAVAYNSRHGEFLVVWENEWLGGRHDIYARRVSAQGEVLDAFVVSAGDNDRVQPGVAYDANRDRYLVVWSFDYWGNGSDWDIWGAYVPWDGSPAGPPPEFAITTGAENSARPRVAWGLAGDRYLVTFENSQWARAGWIAGAYVYPDATFAYLDISTAAEACGSPDVAYNLARDEYLVVWQTIRAGTGQDIYGQRLDGNGNRLHPSEVAIAQDANHETMPAAAACAVADQYVVVWQRAESPTEDDVWGRFIGGDMAFAPARAIQAATGLEQYPAVTSNEPGTHYLLAWQQEQAGGRFGVWSRWLNPDQTLPPAFLVAEPSPTRDRLRPAVASGRTTSLVVWVHQREGSSYQDIYGRLATANTVYVPLALR